MLFSYYCPPLGIVGVINISDVYVQYLIASIRHPVVNISNIVPQKGAEFNNTIFPLYRHENR